jgi:hypothetical protein
MTGTSVYSRGGDLPAEPVGGLHLEYVRRPIPEESCAIAAKLEVAELVKAFANLCPHEEQRRTRTVLPSHYRGASKRSDIEVGIAHDK